MHVSLGCPMPPNWSPLDLCSSPTEQVDLTDLTFLENMVKKYLLSPLGVDIPPPVPLDDKRLQSLSHNVYQLALRASFCVNGCKPLETWTTGSRLRHSQEDCLKSAIGLVDGIKSELEALIDHDQELDSTYIHAAQSRAVQAPKISACNTTCLKEKFPAPSTDHLTQREVKAKDFTIGTVSAPEPVRPTTQQTSITGGTTGCQSNRSKHTHMNSTAADRTTQGTVTPCRPSLLPTLSGSTTKNDRQLFQSELTAVLSRRRAASATHISPDSLGETARSCARRQQLKRITTMLSPPRNHSMLPGVWQHQVNTAIHEEPTTSWHNAQFLLRNQSVGPGYKLPNFDPPLSSIGAKGAGLDIHNWVELEDVADDETDGVVIFPSTDTQDGYVAKLHQGQA
ncbi:hypothetical protein FRB95_013115 [Tulasnella sp. JGI-2019a]|nr:hypothetical protein FRB95_013115 [Tulasnella sp. JGI-2019a]